MLPVNCLSLKSTVSEILYRSVTYSLLGIVYIEYVMTISTIKANKQNSSQMWQNLFFFVKPLYISSESKRVTWKDCGILQRGSKKCDVSILTHGISPAPTNWGNGWLSITKTAAW